MIGLPLLALSLSVAQAAPPVPTPVPATPFPGTRITPLPAATGSPAPGGMTPEPSTSRGPAMTPYPQPTGTVSATATPIAYGYRFVPVPPAHPEPGDPQIMAIYLNSNTLRSQGLIAIKVVTDPGTVKVTSGSNGREGEVPRISPGDFEAVSKLPKIPFIAKGMTIKMRFTALGADGKRTIVDVPVALK